MEIEFELIRVQPERNLRQIKLNHGQGSALVRPRFSFISVSNLAVGIKLVELDGLHGDGGSGAEDGLDRGGAWHLGRWTGESEDELTVVLRSCDVLQ